MKPEEIYQKIAKLMWSVFPEDAVEYSFFGKLYSVHMEGSSILKDKDGNELSFDDGCQSDIVFNVLSAAKELLLVSPFAEKEPWTHFKATLSENGKFKMDFAYIPEQENIVGVFMRGGTKEEIDFARGQGPEA